MIFGVRQSLAEELGFAGNWDPEKEAFPELQAYLLSDKAQDQIRRIGHRTVYCPGCSGSMEGEGLNLTRVCSSARKITDMQTRMDDPALTEIGPASTPVCGREQPEEISAAHWFLIWRLDTAGPGPKAFEKLDHMESSSADLFDQFLKTGMGDKPIIAAYENQMLKFAAEVPENWEQPKVDVIMICPTPMVWSSHIYIVLDGGGEAAMPYRRHIRSAASSARADRSHSSERMVSWTHSGLPFMCSLA